jgi:hypothetical protein
MESKQLDLQQQPTGCLRMKHLCAGMVLTLLMSSCSPVNILTRLKRTPRAYTQNYCCSDIIAPKNELMKESWIVFSDRDGNDTYQNPGGKVKFQKMSFMEAFFVIRVKGNYLQLVKYDPEVVANNPYARIMKNRKKAQYYGWVHQSHMLKTKQSSLDIATGFRSKAVVIISDTLAVTEPHLVFESDSVLAWKDDDLTIYSGKIPVHELLYIYKYSPDRRNVLVGNKTTLTPLGAPEETFGWISASVIKEIGQRLFVDMESLEKDTPVGPVFPDKKTRKPLNINAVTSRGIDFYAKTNPAFKYSPVRSYRRDSLGISFNTAIAAPLIDRRFNYVLNLNGNKIMYEDFIELEKDLKKLNVVFVFEGREKVFRDYSSIMNVIQNVQTRFNGENDSYQYRFGAVLAFQDSVNRILPKIKSCGLTDSYSELMDFLMVEADSVPSYRPVTGSQAWKGLQKAVELIEPYRNETNILIVIGESSDGGYNERADSLLIRRMANANARILGYQVYSETTTAGNNFVLQMENMIDTYVQYETESKRERLVYSSQFKPNPRYRESARNIYALDQQKSMTQGWILFPGKHENLQSDFLSLSMDTLFMEITHDNETVIDCLYRAFNEFGNNRYRYDPLWSGYNGKDSLWALNRELTRRTAKNFPAWYLPSAGVSVGPTDEDLDYYLLLSESEIEEISLFLDDVTRYEPDYRYKGRKNNKRKPCNCADDNLPEEIRDTPLYDKEGHRLYLNTQKTRRYTYKAFMDRLKHSYKLCRTKSSLLKQYSLAGAGLEIVGHPSRGKLVNRYTVKDIKRKKKIRDYELDELILYFKDRKDVLKNYLRTDRNLSFTSNGEPFYWVKRDMLP